MTPGSSMDRVEYDPATVFRVVPGAPTGLDGRVTDLNNDGLLDFVGQESQTPWIGICQGVGSELTCGVPRFQILGAPIGTTDFTGDGQNDMFVVIPERLRLHPGP
jgi:hypothetical protein